MARLTSVVLLGLLGLPLWGVSAAQNAGQNDSTTDVPLYGDLGDHGYAITTRDPKAQAYFDQGLRLYYAFNHAEAIRSFRQAQRIDPECAMCWWGEALAFGPNINMPMDSMSGLAAYAAVERALGVAPGASERERALVNALAVRYERDPSDDRAVLDEAYAQAMKGLADRYADDLDVAVLYAESLMDLRPWDYWTEDGEPQPGMGDALRELSAVLERDANHPGACHFYIHAVEKLYPERAIPCAERLASLMPGAGHIVHMPGHIYIRVGRYLDAIEANEHAVHADESFIQDQRPGTTTYTAGYYPHNYDFLAFAALMAGREAQAISAAERVAALIPEDAFGQPGMAFLQHWSVRSLLVKVRFGKWDDILAATAPPADRNHARAIWHYTRGRAFVAKGDVTSAGEELDRLRALIRDVEETQLRMEFNGSADILHVADKVLGGWSAAAAGRFDEAVDELRLAVRFEDALLYGEPPEWTVPARQDLGAVLVLAGRVGEAREAFREDLERFPENVWSLDGLERLRQ
jgi:tetratricopeptide (TPR) repeat protein